MGELRFQDYYGMSSMPLKEYLKLSGVTDIKSISSLEAADLLAFAPDSVYNDLVAVLEEQGLISYNEGAQAVVDAWNSAASKMTPEQVAKALESQNVIDVEVVKSASGENLEIQIPTTTKNTSLEGGSYNGGNVLRTGMDAKINSEGKVEFSNSSGTYDSTGKPVNGFLGSISSALMTVAVISQLGRIASGLIYKTGKMFGKDLSVLNPDEWHKVTAGNDSFGAVLFNCLFVVNPNTKAVTMYADGDGVACILSSLCENYGWFINDKTVASLPKGETIPLENINYPIHVYSDVFYSEQKLIWGMRLY